MTLYTHVLTVTVLSSECSPDAIEKCIEASFRNDWRPEESISAITLPENRRHAPYVTAPDSPRRESYATDAEYFIARDEWIDALPLADTI